MITKTYSEEDGIKKFNNTIEENHTDYNAKGLDTLFSQEEKHFWFVSRKEYILQNMKRFFKGTEKIIEIGAGTGNVARYLMKHGFSNMSVGEMHLNGLKYARSYGVDKCYQFDLLDTPFEKEFDVVCMFDVLEHIEDDELAIKNIFKSLEDGGKIVLTVPSHQWLWSRDDTIAKHKRRYTKKELVNKLQKQGFEIISAKYFFMSIIPLLLLRSIINRDSKMEIVESEYSDAISINPIINAVLLLIVRLENKISKFLPNVFGGSLFIIAGKSDDSF